MSGPRDRLVAAALECVGRYGIAKTTMDDVARAAGVSRATVYRSFATKDELLVEAIKTEAERVIANVRTAMEAESGIEEQLAAGVRSFASQLEAHEILNRALDTETELLLPLLSVEAEDVASMIGQLIRPHVEAAMSDGSLRVSDARVTVDYVSRMILAYVADRPLDPDLTDIAVCRDFVREELVPRALRA